MMKGILGFVLTAFVLAMWGSAYGLPKTVPPVLKAQNGTYRMWANVVKASDGATYRVSVQDFFWSSGEASRHIEALSADGRYLEISGEAPIGSTNWRYVDTCGHDVKVTKSCAHNTPGAAQLLTELTTLVVKRESIVSNSELMWAWGNQTNKEFGGLLR